MLFACDRLVLGSVPRRGCKALTSRPQGSSLTLPAATVPTSALPRLASTAIWRSTR